MSVIRDVLHTIFVFVQLLAYFYVAGAIVGAFFYGLFSVAGLAPHR